MVSDHAITFIALTCCHPASQILLLLPRATFYLYSCLWNPGVSQILVCSDLHCRFWDRKVWLSRASLDTKQARAVTPWCFMEWMWPLLCSSDVSTLNIWHILPLHFPNPCHCQKFLIIRSLWIVYHKQLKEIAVTIMTVFVQAAEAHVMQMS